jgi:tetratricopeptide (TPR) repeat protein
MQCWANRRYAAAIAHFDKIDQKNGLLASVAEFFKGQALHASALELLDQGRYSEAIRLLRLAVGAVAGDASLSESLCSYISVVYDSKPTSSSATSLQTPVASPESKRISRCISLWRDGHRERALAIARDLLLTDPGNSGDYYNLGLMLAGGGRYDEAIACLETASQLDPDNADIFSAVGLTLAAAEKYADALQAFNRAHLIWPSKAEISLMMATTARSVATLGKPESLTLRPHAAASSSFADSKTDIEKLTEAIISQPSIIIELLDLPPSAADADLLSAPSRAVKIALKRSPDIDGLAIFPTRLEKRIADSRTKNRADRPPSQDGSEIKLTESALAQPAA